MSGWISNDPSQHTTAGGGVAAAVAAAAAEVSATTDYAYIPELDLYADKSSGYYFKQGKHDFYHAASHYTYHFDENTYRWECTYQPDWDSSVGCPLSLDAYLLIGELLDQIESAESVENDADLLEEGECSNESSCSDDEMLPCIRAVVLESDELPYGYLHIITVDGAFLCFDVEQSSLELVNDCRGLVICRFIYDKKENTFRLDNVYLKEKPDNTGQQDIKIFVNSKLAEDETVTLNHQDRLSVEVNETNFLVFSLHIHRGLNTCASCEPGLLLAGWSGNPTVSTCQDQTSSSTRASLERQRRGELNKLKRRYGLQSAGYVREKVDPEKGKVSGEESENIFYTDRAEIRRKTVGSDLPESASKIIAEKVGSTSATKFVDEKNRGYKLLQKMGWKKGEGAGKRSDGIQEPICPVGHLDTSGLGAHVSIRVAIGDVHDAQRRMKWSKAAQRFAKLTGDQESSCDSNKK